MDPIAIGLVLLALVVAVECRLGYHLLIRNGRTLLRIDDLERRLRQRDSGEAPDGRTAAGLPSTGLPIGFAFPDFELPALPGGRVALSRWRGWPVLLILVDPRSPSSLEILPDLAGLSLEPPSNGLLPIVVTTGGLDENRRLFEAHGVRCPVLADGESEVAILSGVAEMPAAYLIGPDGTTLNRLAVGPRDVRALIDGAAGRLDRTGGGNPAATGAALAEAPAHRPSST